MSPQSMLRRVQRSNVSGWSHTRSTSPFHSRCRSSRSQPLTSHYTRTCWHTTPGPARSPAVRDTICCRPSRPLNTERFSRRTARCRTADRCADLPSTFRPHRPSNASIRLACDLQSYHIVDIIIIIMVIMRGVPKKGYKGIYTSPPPPPPQKKTKLPKLDLTNNIYWCRYGTC